jgi:hypothetical protein
VARTIVEADVSGIAAILQNGLQAAIRCTCTDRPKTTVCERPLQYQKRAFLERYRMAAVRTKGAFAADASMAAIPFASL